MLYLIRSFGRGNKKSALKVGYSENLGLRFKSYYHHNPFFETIGIRQGDEYTELLTHLYLQSYNLKLGILNEWFLDLPSVYLLFHHSTDRMRKRVWKKRQDLFSALDFKDPGLKCRIYEDLRMVFYNPERAKEIDRAWKMESNKKILRRRSCVLD